MRLLVHTCRNPKKKNLAGDSASAGSVAGSFPESVFLLPSPSSFLPLLATSCPSCATEGERAVEQSNDVSLLSFRRVDVQRFRYSQGFGVASSQVGDGTRRVILGRSNSHRRYLSTSSPFPMIPHINTWRKGRPTIP